MYSEEKDIRPGVEQRALAVCRECGSAHPFLRLPLFNITGASGTGKTTLALAMAAQDITCIHLETDILWSPVYNTPEDDYRAFRKVWLLMANYISQSGHPVALYGSVVPSQLDACPEHQYFSKLYYLALVCEPDVLVERLKARPSWRQAGSDGFIHRMIDFNQWFIDQAALPGSPITQFDTSRATLEETVNAVRGWIAERWPVTEEAR
jgi:hypothetical protein